mmetsp:Transcript_21115/g.69690  ORF Transcript_21115/g.69690 Transcript_21115/m.69690 type:complete len:218 (-) Transcript_21115:1401-2054(-)
MLRLRLVYGGSDRVLEVGSMPLLCRLLGLEHSEPHCLVHSLLLPPLELSCGVLDAGAESGLQRHHSRVVLHLLLPQCASLLLRGGLLGLLERLVDGARHRERHALLGGLDPVADVGGGVAHHQLDLCVGLTLHVRPRLRLGSLEAPLLLRRVDLCLGRKAAPLELIEPLRVLGAQRGDPRLLRRLQLEALPREQAVGHITSDRWRCARLAIGTDGGL